VPLLQGSAPPFEGKLFHHEKGAIALLKIDGKAVTKIGTFETGGFPEGVGFSKDGPHLYVGDLADKQISVFEVNEASRKRVNTIPLPDFPASLPTQVP
jgi:DNA-binding beta-propeller fold protein YncE